jgi:hypothetical protein
VISRRMRTAALLVGLFAGAGVFLGFYADAATQGVSEKTSRHSAHTVTTSTPVVGFLSPILHS